MHKKLEEIIARTKEDLAHRKARLPLEILKDSLVTDEPTRPFKEAIKHPKKGSMAVIAEVKLASPSTGPLGSSDDIPARVSAYEAGGASALSIVTEKHFFGGDPWYLRIAKSASALPVLEKNFIVNQYQLYEARSAGADAILLIARLLPPSELKALVLESQIIGLEPVVEVYDAEDLKSARATEADIIAVNARNLDTFSVDVVRAAALLASIPPSYVRIGFSGVFSPPEAKAYKDAGADAVLVGTALMQAPDIGKFLEEII